MSPFALLTPAVWLAHTGLIEVQAILTPVLGGASVAVAIVLLTLVVRALLVPLSVRVVRADRARLALAPRLDRLRRKHSGDPARLMREVAAVHRDAGTGQFAGMLPALAQTPFLMVIYRLCTTAVIAGGPNLVLTSNLFGAPLAQHGLAILTTAGLLSAPGLVVLTMVTAMTAVAAWSSSIALARVRAAAAAVPAGRGRPANEPAASQLLLARVMPFGTVAAVMVVPLAVSLYLLTSTTWAVAERAILPRLV